MAENRTEVEVLVEVELAETLYLLLLERNATSLAQMLTRKSGNVISESRFGEVQNNQQKTHLKQCYIQHPARCDLPDQPHWLH